MRELTRILPVDILWLAYGSVGSVRQGTGGIHESVKRLAYTLRKEVKLMPITLTFHVFGYTITLKVTKKSNNRHSAK